MNCRPLHDRLVVRRLDDGEQTVGGIIIPDSAKEKPQRGTVIAAGSGTVSDVALDGEPLLIMRENEVQAVTHDAPTAPTSNESS